MSILGTVFRPGQTLKADDLNLMVGAINDNDKTANAAKQTAENNSRAIDILRNKDEDISESEFEALKKAGHLDKTKTYYIYEDE